MDVRPEPIHEALLSGVANRIASRIGAQNEVETDGRAPGAEVLRRHAVGSAALEAQELLMRGACRGGDAPQAQAGADARRTFLATKQLEGLVGSAPTAIRRSLPRAHPAMLAPGALLAVMDPRLHERDDAGPADGPSDNPTCYSSGIRVHPLSCGPRHGPCGDERREFAPLPHPRARTAVTWSAAGTGAGSVAHLAAVTQLGAARSRRGNTTSATPIATAPTAASSASSGTLTIPLRMSRDAR